MHAFMHQSETLGMCAAHEQDRKCVDDNVVQSHRNGDDENRLEIDPKDRQCIADGGNSSKIAAKGGCRSTVRTDE
jgi:hypothetical protein